MSDWRPGGHGFDPRQSRQHSFLETDHEIFSMVIPSLPLIQEGQLSVSGKRMCTILVNRLEDEACPVNIWLGKLTALDMTPLGRKTSTQTNKQQLSSALSSAYDFKSHFLQTMWTQIKRSSLIRIHTVCLYAKIGLKSLQEYSADDINRRHFQMQVFLEF